VEPRSQLLDERRGAVGVRVIQIDVVRRRADRVAVTGDLLARDRDPARSAASASDRVDCPMPPGESKLPITFKPGCRRVSSRVGCRVPFRRSIPKSRFKA
jgi:hypothetical protein